MFFFFFFQAEDGIRDKLVTEFRRVLFRSDNILLENPTGRVLVTDFGIARVGAGGGTTGPREVVGAAEFMSPQQASGGGGGRRSGLFFPRGVAHYPLSGPPPFRGGDADGLLAGPPPG